MMLFALSKFSWWIWQLDNGTLCSSYQWGGISSRSCSPLWLCLVVTAAAIGYYIWLVIQMLRDRNA